MAKGDFWCFCRTRTAGGAKAVGRRIVEGIRTCRFRSGGVTLMVTASVGIASLRRGKAISFARLIRDAHTAVKAAQLKGGDRATLSRRVTKPMPVIGCGRWPTSRSPAMQTALQRLQHRARLRLFRSRWRRKSCAPRVEGAAALGVRGLNVTIPHKEAVLALCAAGRARRAGGRGQYAVFDGGRVRGTNTDVHGFEKLMEEPGARARRKADCAGRGRRGAGGGGGARRGRDHTRGAHAQSLSRWVAATIP